MKKSIYLRRKSRGGKRPELEAGGVVMAHWDARRSEEMDLGRQQASHRFFGTDIGAPRAAEHLLTFSLPELSQRGGSSATL